ncbi:CHAT domain-containing protein [Mycolicibacterium arenosum]|uniref:CHAT domain-containing protein n=1 Tax=Mycolicibacterium arenosum TaxID=2952157 RepID=A0ABT1M088_9MYCO|nr:CHAT domain-containing protein [Mycolicibacterium sp. CAU 1645]MCP9272568.1 CHAT domain-containing protein [Mycolicibacterium sp. CAU 1645]
MAVTRRTLVLRYADVGIATYGSLRVVGEPSRIVTWVLEEPLLLAALAELDAAIPEPGPGESLTDALTRALADGPFTTPAAELELAYRLGVLLLSEAAWKLLLDCVATPRAVLFVAPSARLARVPWGLLALPALRPPPADLVAARAAAITAEGSTAAAIPWPAEDIALRTEGHRLMELVDVLMTLPANVVHSARARVSWSQREGAPALLVLDPRVPNQRADSALGSVLGRPDPDSSIAGHFQGVLGKQPVRPPVGTAVELFRRADADRAWLAAELSHGPSRMLFVGHATAADVGRADQAAIHLADEVALTAVDVMALRLEMPPRVALLACASGGDYRFDEATGLVAAVVLGGAELVTATLWTLPTTAGFTRFAHGAAGDPMADVVMAVDDAHQADDAGCAVNAWQRAQMRRWRAGDTAASPVYWAALVTFTVDGAR